MKPTGSTHNDHLLVRTHTDFFADLRDRSDPFRICDLQDDYENVTSRIERARRKGLVTVVDEEIFHRDRSRYIYELTDRAEELVEEYDVTYETPCPCSCRRDGFHNREDGFYCPNPDCDEGPFTREELNASVGGDS